MRLLNRIITYLGLHNLEDLDEIEMNMSLDEALDKVAANKCNEPKITHLK